MNSFIQISMLFTVIYTPFLWGDTVELISGKALQGNLTGRQSIYVILASKVAQGEIVRRLKPDEIAHIHFSDSTTKQEVIDRYAATDPQQTTFLLESLVRRRLPYMDLLSHSDETLFAMLLESYINSGRANDALDRAKLWRTKLRFPDIVDQLDELQIVAARSSDHLEEAAFYSKRWIDAGKSARETALPWSVLAEKALIESQTEDALWLALNPIVFTYPAQPRFLENAYEIAIFSAFQLEDREYASTLYNDMRKRNLSWPINSERTYILDQLNLVGRKKSPNPSIVTERLSRQSAILIRVRGSP